ncbi:SP_1767 family glycosyltransferase [Limosilactobacillus oris]|uniref:SP_1767 family glycosyltransferase n=1 Tax=Limosilactobacillus oris TaxID=1632 RepID=UPI0022366C7C|nr:SP_1767 family glycosyltransferase [Limosilactobacillus oris]MCW4387874.1 SP_1767 family glycosyltransferase [Limosilactobacillus oris]
MAIYVTSDGSLYQERIAEALHGLGAKRLSNAAQFQANDTVVVQGAAMPQQLRQPSQPLTVIAWLPTYGWSPAQQEPILDLCRHSSAVVVPTARAKDWLVKEALSSEKITTCQLVGGSASVSQPANSQQVHQQLPDQLPRAVARAQLNQAGGWGDLGLPGGLTDSDKLVDFISAGLPLLVSKQDPAAELVSHCQLGCVYGDDQEKRALPARVTPERYQQLAANVQRIGKLLGQDYFVQQAFNQARYQASVSSIDATKQRARFDLHVLDNQETLDYIERYQPSVARLGDGEISLMLGAGQVFQDLDARLEKRLREIVETPSNPRLLVCLSDTFHDLGRLVPKAQKWWRGHQQTFASFYGQLGQLGNTYGNTMVTRPYMDLQDRGEAGEVFHRIKQWWQDRDLLIVEGAYTRSGVGSDLYDNARSVQRIICPPKNAWGKYQEIEAAIKRYGEGKLVLVMLGMAATVIAADLADWGQVIDSGHLDPEYEWYRQGAVDRVPIQGKHTAEMNYDQGVPQSIDDPQYNAEIVLDLSK